MNILVVDDDYELGLLLSRFLSKHGYRVVTAADGLQAFEVLAAHAVDLVITDYRMPFLDGLGLVERLRRELRYQALPVILMTAYGDGEVFEQGLRKGVAMTLPKPINFDSLLHLVRFAS